MERPEHFFLDTRIRQRALAKGFVTQQQVDSHLSALPERGDAFTVLDVAQPAVAPRVEPEPVREPPLPLTPVGVTPAEPAAMSAPATLQSPLGGAADEDVAEPAPPTPVMINPAELRAAWENSAAQEPAPLVAPAVVVSSQPAAADSEAVTTPAEEHEGSEEPPEEAP